MLLRQQSLAQLISAPGPAGRIFGDRIIVTSLGYSLDVIWSARRVRRASGGGLATVRPQPPATLGRKGGTGYGGG